MTALEELLERNGRQPARDRLDKRQLFEALRRTGYAGGYDAVRRYARRWADIRATKTEAKSTEAFIPLTFAPAEAYQFDWSEEWIVLDGVIFKVQVAHARLCHSRMPYIRAYPRQSQEMMFDAHARAFAFWGGACERGIYDNMKTAVDAVFVGKERKFNRRFARMCSHYPVEPTACTPAAGWEKGQVENQVGSLRQRLFIPRPHVKTLEELNLQLEDGCVAYARESRHPDDRERTVWEAFEAERPALVPIRGPFDGFREVDVGASKTCLVRFDRNRYSIEAKAANRPVQLRAYADRVVVRFDGEVVATHERVFGSGRVRYNPLHYLPVLARKPGALRNGAPFKDWELPPNLTRLRARLGRSDEADRQFVGHPRRHPRGRSRRRRGSLSAGLVRRPVQPRCGAQHPLVGSRPCAAGALGGAVPDRSCASSPRLIALVTTVCASSARRSTVERHDLLALMAKLKLAGMRAAYDDIIRDGLKRQRSVQQILGDLLSAEVAEKESTLDQLSDRRR